MGTFVFIDLLAPLLANFFVCNSDANFCSDLVCINNRELQVTLGDEEEIQVNAKV